MSLFRAKHVYSQIVKKRVVMLYYDYYDNIER